MPFSISSFDGSFHDNFDAPEIAGLRVPEEFYWIITEQPPLAGMQLPSRDTPWEELYRNGFRWIVCLCSDRPVYDPKPLRSLVEVELSDLVETELPEDPEMEERAIRIIGRKIDECLANGEGVIVHCAGGRGRTGTVLGAVLVRNGWPPDRAVALLDAVHRARGKSGWPESPWQQKVVERSLPSDSESDPA